MPVSETGNLILSVVNARFLKKMANTNASNQPIVMFDEFSKLRILDPAQFEASEKLKEECKDFTQSNYRGRRACGLLDR